MSGMYRKTFFHIDPFYLLIYLFIYLFILVVGVKSRALHMLSKLSTTELHPRQTQVSYNRPKDYLNSLCQQGAIQGTGLFISRY
jgi:hypothetical protein